MAKEEGLSDFFRMVENVDTRFWFGEANWSNKTGFCKNWRLLLARCRRDFHTNVTNIISIYPTLSSQSKLADIYFQMWTIIYIFADSLWLEVVFLAFIFPIESFKN